MDSLVDEPDLSDLRSAPWGPLGRGVVIAAVATFGRFVMTVMNTTRVVNESSAHDAIMARPRDVGLVTVSNHTSTFDDPGVISILAPGKYFLQEYFHGGTRWSVCAEDICFRNEFLRQFFLTGKTLPITRGGGVSQPVLQGVSQFVQQGEWLHIFPEGYVGTTGNLRPLKWGIGKIICDAVKETGGEPMVLPIYHSGMEQVMPRKARFPRWGNEVRVVVGRPLDLSGLTCNCGKEGTEQQAWKDITEHIRRALMELQDGEAQNGARTFVNGGASNGE
ncbi:unnamed protein product [Ostreobium quekettii]|uniref:Tafazzin family protein n=1 Tax=Ostreobium quekettii TaxID=121088 RepID=A0A8S1JEU2_9CHLO|nr:unnamed protein product [Ostreobium quekettii]